MPTPATVRTKAAEMAIAKADAFAKKIGPLIYDMIASGATPCIVAKVLTDLGYPTARYAKRWSAAGVTNALSRFVRIVGASMPSLTGPSISD